MTTLATIVFKSGATVELPFAAAHAKQLLEDFEEFWDEAGPELVVPATGDGSGCRLVGGDIAGIFVTAADDDDDDADEDEDDDAEDDGDDSEDGENDGDDDGETAASEADEAQA